ncbi:S-formylglutathione hydrolase-like isoform X1 [Pecten maximus]|uniref:S-formylglutathione hydrolase-like isoform X1 n=2 Tax=Pecten maximus TaxID=6579 RepID=UPI00145867C6|nr:S-formylglutathione hydrolase-like isoform X1 [Pecten maximus]
MLFGYRRVFIEVHQKVSKFLSFRRRSVQTKTMALTEVSSNKMFGGWQKVFSHESSELKCVMKFGVFIPAQAENKKVPVLYWLSGLTCTEQNFVTKAGSQKYAAEHGLIIVAPDTSPRGCNIEGEDDAYDFGSGAGFYVNATQDKWKTNYRMYAYVTEELPAVITSNFAAIPDKMSIFGHSMGGHGALICALKNPGKYKSVSAFAPICNPMNCPWGQKAFSGYLGENKDDWKAYDATELVKQYNGPPLEIHIDQGKADNFLPAGQLLPDNFVAACAEAKMPVVLRMQEGYDHSYYFMATFMEDHLKHHAKILNQ